MCMLTVQLWWNGSTLQRTSQAFLRYCLLKAEHHRLVIRQLWVAAKLVFSVCRERNVLMQQFSAVTSIICCLSSGAWEAGGVPGLLREKHIHCLAEAQFHTFGKTHQRSSVLPYLTHAHSFTHATLHTNTNTVTHTHTHTHTVQIHRDYISRDRLNDLTFIRMRKYVFVTSSIRRINYGCMHAP